jgi:hypothetical protein
VRTLVLTLVALALAAAPAEGADVQRVTSGMSPHGAAAFATDEAGTTAVAYETRRGIVVRVARGGGRFGRPVLAAPRRRGGRVDHDGDLEVEIGGGRVLVAWTRSDRSYVPDPDDRDDSCCDRVHAVVVGADDRPGRPRPLSPSGQSV